MKEVVNTLIGFIKYLNNTEVEDMILLIVQMFLKIFIKKQKNLFTYKFIYANM